VSYLPKNTVKFAGSHRTTIVKCLTEKSEKGWKKLTFFEAMIELALNINALLSISYTDYEGFEVT